LGQLGRSPNRIDLLTGINGVNFEEAWETKLFRGDRWPPLFHNQQRAFAEKQTRDRSAGKITRILLLSNWTRRNKLITPNGLAFTSPPDAG
jgi:hypothetical protein